MKQSLAGVAAVAVAGSVLGLWFLGERTEPEEALAGTTLERGTGEPLARVELRLIPRALLSSLRDPGEVDARPHSVTTSTASGEFRFTGVPPGKYRLEAHAPGHVPYVLPLVQVPFPGSLLLDLLRGGTVEGVAVTPGGAPVPGATVRATGLTQATALTDAQGRFTLTLPPGSHALSAVRAQEAGAVDAPLQVQPDHPLRGLRVVLGAGALLEGHVMRPEGSPVPGARVEVFAEGAQAPDVRVGTDAAGAFRVAPLAPGTYRVQAHSPEGGPSPTQPVSVAAGERVSLTLISPMSGPAPGEGARRLQGHVIDPRGHAVQDFRLEVTPLDTQQTRALDFMGDRFELALSPGRYRLYVSLADGERTEWTLDTEARALTPIDVLVHPGMPLSGRVVDPVTREPLKDITVLTARYGLAVTQADGRFVFRDLPPGAHTLEFQRPGAKAFHPITLEPGKAQELGDLPFVPAPPAPR
ncbi:MSCRAMM family protein [Stigmatella erecta]|uniref:Carboxypeptidase regulatory-like domain-containing protein n=1 Tax=Stigmatella erecta TaxID=83460 RepID=A0A1I0H2P3_9BACT|nr:carboxypeptidase regulatory-like domain-containing protein [Stigmatella erecta]SET77968.1 Carboxypeptidase regulatory-like domain-containing protein [Stigmatella erecta]